MIFITYLDATIVGSILATWKHNFNRSLMLWIAFPLCLRTVGTSGFRIYTAFEYTFSKKQEQIIAF